MARKAKAQGSRKSASRKSNVINSEFSGSKKSFLAEMMGNPAFKYAIGGIASAALAKLATKISDRYPEIGNFIRENLDTLETRLNDYKGQNRFDSSSTRYS